MDLHHLMILIRSRGHALGAHCRSFLTLVLLFSAGKFLLLNACCRPPCRFGAISGVIEYVRLKWPLGLPRASGAGIRSQTQLDSSQSPWCPGPRTTAFSRWFLGPWSSSIQHLSMASLDTLDRRGQMLVGLSKGCIHCILDLEVPVLLIPIPR